MTGLPSWARITRARREHIERVADLLRQWAREMDVGHDERQRWFRAAYLHDALKDAPVSELRALAPQAWGSDALRHGPAAAVLAEREGERDPGILDAVRYHSVGYAGWDDVGRMLYLADYLEPGRGDHGGRAERVGRVPRDPAGVLRDVARERIAGALTRDHRLLPETVAFWNALAADD